MSDLLRRARAEGCSGYAPRESRDDVPTSAAIRWVGEYGEYDGAERFTRQRREWHLRCATPGQTSVEAHATEIAEALRANPRVRDFVLAQLAYEETTVVAEARGLLAGLDKLDGYKTCEGTFHDEREWGMSEEIPYDDRRTEEIWGHYIYGSDGHRVVGAVKHRADAEFISAAPRVLTTLVAEVERLRSEVESLRRMRGKA